MRVYDNKITVFVGTLKSSLHRKKILHGIFTQRYFFRGILQHHAVEVLYQTSMLRMKSAYKLS